MPLDIQAIVCAVDLSPFSPLVVSHGVRLARRVGVPLHLIHAVPNPQDGAHPTTLFERGGDLQSHSDKARRRIDDLMVHAPVDWDAVVRFGDPVEQLVTFVDSLPPSLVVSASHGVSGFRRLFIGTVVERLTRKLDRPMLVVKPTEREDLDLSNDFRRALVSCDGHGHWQRFAGRLPLLLLSADSKIHLVHALEGPLTEAPEDDVDAPYERAQQSQIERLRRRMKEQAAELLPRDSEIAVVVEPGVPQEMMLRICREQSVDLLIVGVRHSATVGRWIAGSTTETLLRHAPCCVLTVPEPGDPAKAGRQQS